MISSILIFAVASAASAEGTVKTVDGAASACLEARVAIAAGAIPDLSDFTAVPCQPDRLIPLSYDALAKMPRVKRALEPGDMVRPWPGTKAGTVRPGDVMVLAASAGAVRIERKVRALQPATPGQELFVQDSEGQVFSVRYEGGAR